MTRPRRLLLLAGALVVGALLVFALQPLAVFRVLGWLFPRIVWRVPTNAPMAALSFDDGPDPVYTPQVLATLARHEAHATFFLIGASAARHPDLVARIRREGHEIGNHSNSTTPTHLRGTEAFEADLLAAEAVLGLVSARPKLFRPASGLIRPAQVDRAERHGYTVVLGSAYPYDPRRPPVPYIRWLVSKNLAPGVVVILHDAGGDRSNTVAALEPILAAGTEKGLRFVTVGELLGSAFSESRIRE